MDGMTFRRKLLALATDAFPITGNGEITQEKMMNRLRELWLTIVARFPEEAYGLTVNQYSFLIDFQASGPDAKFDLEQFPGWLQHCKAEFLERTKFVNIHIIPPQKRRKHWLRADASTKQVENMTKRSGDSLFYRPVDPHMVEGWLWMCMGEYFEAFLAGEPRYYYLKANRPIGASGGEPVEYICVDVDFSAGAAHAYPIPESEVGDTKYLFDISTHGVEIHTEEEPSAAG